jgi:two-component system, NarL family, response regulator LiaR
MKAIILADNQDITKAGILFLLGNLKIIENVHEAENKKELLTNLSVNNDSVVILDYTIFDFTSMEDLLIVSSRFKATHWVLFSEELSNDFLRYTLYNSCNFSIVYKDCSKEEINSALSLALKNERFICNKASNQLLGKQNQNIEKENCVLTSTEKEILRLIALGKTTKEIALERFSSTHTITTHRKNIFRKLEVNSVHEATKYALRAGILDSAEYYI